MNKVPGHPGDHPSSEKPPRRSTTPLTRQAREAIKARGLWAEPGQRVTIAGYTRYYFGDAGWQGDRCGCVDNRCIGFHHDDETDCHCLEVWLDDYVAATRDVTR